MNRVTKGPAKPSLQVATKAPSLLKKESYRWTAVDAPVPTPRPNTVQLHAELAQRQLRLVDAQRYLGQGLTQASLLETTTDLEDAVGSALRKVAQGGQVRADALYRAATSGLGAKANALLPLVFESHAAAIRADLPASEQAAFDDKAAGLFERLAGQVLKNLGESVPPDRKAAFASMQAASEQLNGLRTPHSNMYAGFHAYTNEAGLWPLLQSLPVNSGAVVGVGGAVLEVAAQRRASLVVLADVQPELRSFILAVAGILLTVDQMADDQGWDDNRRCDEFRRRLGQKQNSSYGVTTRDGQGELQDPKTTVEEFKGIGVDEDTLPPLLASLEKANSSYGGPRWIDDNESVLHLMQLALQGRIIATTTDLGDKALPARLATLLEAHQVGLGTLHLSNALDYTDDALIPKRLLEALPTQVGTLVTSSGDWGASGELLGSFNAPLATPVDEWLAPDGTQSKLTSSGWFEGRVARRYASVQARFARIGIELPPEPPSTLVELQSRVEQAEAKIFANPKLAKQWTRAEMGERQSIPDDAVGMMLKELKAPQRDALASPPPKSAAAFEARLNARAHRYWTPKRKLALAVRTIGRSKITPDAWQKLQTALPRMTPSLVRFTADQLRRTASRSR